VIAGGRAPDGRSDTAVALAAVLTLAAVASDATAAQDLGDTLMLAETCTGCHGRGGVSTGPALPSIAGLDKVYLARTMVQFRNGERPTTIMERIARGHSESELRQMAKHFGALPWVGWRGMPDPGSVAEGHRLHDRVCAECHEREGRHQDRETPRIAGQAPDYLFLSLLQYRDERGAAALPQPSKMLDALAPLSDAQLRQLADYYASRD
jgi:sulfide dehydrogenase cytochrome subunit